MRVEEVHWSEDHSGMQYVCDVRITVSYGELARRREDMVDQINEVHQMAVDEARKRSQEELKPRVIRRLKLDES